MGTSTSQPSPRTQDWQEAREQYKQRNARARDVVGAIARALGSEFEADMAAAPVARCLDVLLRHVDEGSLASAPDGPQVGARIREDARSELAELGTSRQAETALDALFQTALAQIDAQHEAGAEPPPIAQQFMAHYVAGLFRHIIDRDAADYVGGEGLPTVGDRALLEQQCERLCTEAIYGAGLPPIAPPAAPPDERTQYIAERLTPFVADVLARLRMGGSGE